MAAPKAWNSLLYSSGCFYVASTADFNVLVVCFCVVVGVRPPWLGSNWLTTWWFPNVTFGAVWLGHNWNRVGDYLWCLISSLVELFVGFVLSWAWKTRGRGLRPHNGSQSAAGRGLGNLFVASLKQVASLASHLADVVGCIITVVGRVIEATYIRPRAYTLLYFQRNLYCRS